MGGAAAKKIPLTVIMLGVVSLFTDAATEMIYPLVPMYVAALGSGAVILGVIEGVAETTAAMLKLISGIISDKAGKRKLLVLIGYTISTIARPFTGVVATAWQIVFVRMFDRVGKGIRSAPRDALIASSVNESIRGKSYGFHRAMDHAGAVIGPLLAIAALMVLVLAFGVKDTLSALRWTYILSIIPGALAVATIIFFVKEASPKAGRSKAFKFSLRDFDRNFIKYLFVLLLFTLGNSSDAFLLFRVEEAIHESGAVIDFIGSIGPLRDMVSNLGDAEQQARLINLLFLPLIWSFFHIIKVIFSTPFGALSDRIGRKITINIGWAIYAFVYISFALLVFLPVAVQVAATFILFAVYALFYAFTEGTEKAFVADIVEEGKRGSAFGMYNFAVGLGALPASVIFGFLYSGFNKLLPGFGGTVAFGFGGLVALVSMALLAIIVKEPGKSDSRIEVSR
ncbi:MAG: MFS transporter [Chitinispirillaceae bacterium]|nr:MFS transporter [Chitinispirillaceae bacterium]